MLTTPALVSMVQGDLDLNTLHDNLRARRALPRSDDLMLANPRVKSSPRFTKIVTDARAFHTDN